MAKKLSVIVAGQLIGEIKMKIDGPTTIVEGGGIILTGDYLMNPKEIEEMVYKKMVRDNIKINEY